MAQDPTGVPTGGELEALRLDNTWWKGQAAALDAATQSGDVQSAVAVFTNMYGFEDPSIIQAVSADRSAGDDTHFAVGVDLGNRAHVLGVPRGIKHDADTKMGGFSLSGPETSGLLEWLALVDAEVGGVNVVSAYNGQENVFFVYQIGDEYRLFRAGMRGLLDNEEVPHGVGDVAHVDDNGERVHLTFYGEKSRFSNEYPRIMSAQLDRSDQGGLALTEAHFHENGANYALTPLDFQY